MKFLPLVANNLGEGSHYECNNEVHDSNLEEHKHTPPFMFYMLYITYGKRVLCGHAAAT